MSPSVRDSLLVHADFVRRLAARLAGADGDDLAQDTWACAFAAARAPVEPRSWLATIANNLTRNVRRAAGRRERREAAHDVPTTGPSVAEILQREEVRQRVVAAVVALPERLREVVLLHFYEGLDSSAIGRRLGAPASTVRSRLQQALVQLRQQLDREHGERRAWLVPLGGWLLPAQALRVAFGVRATLALGAVLLLALLTAPWWWGGPPVPVTPIVDERQEVVDAAPSRQPAANEREVAAAPPAVAAADDAHGPEDLWGRVVAAADGAPVVGAEVVVEHRPADEIANLDDSYGRRVEVVAKMRTDGEGRFVCRVRRDLQHRVRVTANGFAPLRQAFCCGGAGLELRLERPAFVDGVVRRGDGTPLANVLVEVVLRGSLPGGAIGASSGADGSFYVGGLPPGTSYVRARPTGLLPPPWQTVELVAGGSARCEFSIAAGRHLRGVVRDAATGLGIAGARVQAGERVVESGNVVESGSDGAFELTGLPAAIELEVGAENYGSLYRKVAADADEVVIDLSRGETVAGRVRQRDGTPIAGAYVAAIAELPFGVSYRVQWIGGTTATDGSFSLRGLVDTMARADGVFVGLRWQLLVRAEGFGARALALPGLETAAGGIDIVLEPAGALEVRLIDEDGAAVVAQDVTLIGVGGDFAQLLPEGGFAGEADFYLKRRITRTGTDGRCRFAGLATGDYTLSVTVEGGANVSGGPYAVAAGERVVAPDLKLLRGLSISGTASLPVGVAAEGRLAVVASSDNGNGSADVRADGTFTIEGLEPGRYTLHVATRVPGYGVLPIPDVQAGARDVTLHFEPAVTIEGRVVGKDGQPIPRATVAFFARGLSTASNDRADAEGRFVIEVAPGAAGKLSSIHPDDPMKQGRVEDVVAGQRDIVITLRGFGESR